MMKRKASAALIAATSAAVAKRQAVKKAKFLRALAELPSVKRAAALAGIDRTSIYKMRAADAEFSEKWRQILDESIDLIESRALEFALTDSDPATANARVRLWEFLLKSWRPSTYRERQELGILGGFIHVPMKESKEP